MAFLGSPVCAIAMLLSPSPRVCTDGVRSLARTMTELRYDCSKEQLYRDSITKSHGISNILHLMLMLILRCWLSSKSCRTMLLIIYSFSVCFPITAHAGFVWQLQWIYQLVAWCIIIYENNVSYSNVSCFLVWFFLSVIVMFAQTR